MYRKWWLTLPGVAGVYNVLVVYFTMVVIVFIEWLGRSISKARELNSELVTFNCAAPASLSLSDTRHFLSSR